MPVAFNACGVQLPAAFNAARLMLRVQLPSAFKSSMLRVQKAMYKGKGLNSLKGFGFWFLFFGFWFLEFGLWILEHET